MIRSSEVVSLMLETLPGFRERWDKHVAKWEGKEAGLYNDVGQFAHHIIELHTRGDVAGVQAGFRLVERLLVEGDEEAQGLGIVGVLEGIQNIASHHSSGYSVFEPFLGRQSLLAWRKLEQVWEGKESLAEVVASEVGVEAERKPWWAFWSRSRSSGAPVDPESIENPELREIVEELNRSLGLRGPKGRDGGA